MYILFHNDTQVILSDADIKSYYFTNPFMRNAMKNYGYFIIHDKVINNEKIILSTNKQESFYKYYTLVTANGLYNKTYYNTLAYITKYKRNQKLQVILK